MAYTSIFGIKSPTTTERTPAQSQQDRAASKIAAQTQAQLKVKKKKQQDDEAAQKQSNSFINKIGRTAKSVASAATTGEKAFVTPIARRLPGGTADIDAQNAGTQQAAQNIAFIKKKKQTPLTAKIIKANVESGDQSRKQLTQTIKEMPSKKQVAFGAASTAADILTAGQLPEIKAAVAGEKVAKAGKVASVIAKTKKIARAEAPLVAGNATAGGLNAAAGGGDKKTVINNALAGAVLPEALHVVGTTGANAGGRLLDKISTKPAKQLIKNAKVQTLLDRAGTKPATAAEAEAPDVITAKALHTVMDKIKTPNKVLAAENNKALLAKTEAETTEKNRVAGSKLDQKIELIEAKKADGKFTNVDKVKVQQLKAEKDALAVPEGQTLDTVPSAATRTFNTEQQALEQASKKGDTFGVAQATHDLKTASGDAALTGESTVGASAGKLFMDAQKAGKPISMDEAKNLAGNVEAPAPAAVERGTSKIGQSVQEKAVARGLKGDFGDSAQYDKITIADQAKKAVELVNNKPELERVISGETPLPAGLRATSIIKAVETHPELSKDAELLKKLSQAEHIVGESSRSAQELRIAAERGEHSPIEAMRRLRAARVSAVERRSGKTLAKATSSEVKAIRAAQPKIPKETWTSFIDGLKC